jgi:uncharacterized protein (TIGR00255 family)
MDVNMIRSMTAFARHESQIEQGELVWEMRSVNHRYLEVFVRMPEEFRALEPRVREVIGKHLRRGKVEAGLRFNPSPVSTTAISVNIELLKQLHDALREVSIHAPDVKSPTSMDVLRWPGVVEPRKQDVEALHASAMEALEVALEQMVSTREREGESLSGMISMRTRQAAEQVVKAKERMPVVLQEIRQRLEERLGELREEMDPARIEQEMVLLAQRLDIDEEMDRLSTHLAEVDRVLMRKEPVGRRLDFLMQELNREANTLASKSSDAEMTAIGVELKVLIEQMREQVQNIE